MTAEQSYHYVITISDSSQVVRSGLISSIIPGCAYITIHSEEFSSFKLCEQKMSSLLRIIEDEESKLSNIRYTSIVKVNPLLEEETEFDIIDTNWDPKLVLKKYIVTQHNIINNPTKITFSISGLIYSALEL